MASKVSGVIEYIQPGGSSGTKYAIAATAYGVCDTAANEPIKNVDMTGFKLQEGMTVHIKFTNANFASNPKLKFNSEANTNAKPIVQYGTTAVGITEETNGWYDGAVLTLTYDGTSWVRDQDNNTWRDIQDNLTSDSTTDSLSAKQGKVLKGLIDAMDASTPAASGNATAFIDSLTQTDGKITSITKKTIPAASTSTAGIVKIGTTANDAAAGNHNHDSIYSYIHLTDYDFTDTQPLSKYVTFDKSKPVGAPKEEWYNGFISSHSNYHASYIINGHTNQNEWYVGHGIWREANTPHATAPTWYLLAHNGNVGTGDNNGQVKIAGVNVSVKGLKALAYKDSLVASDIPDLSWNKITSDKPTTLSGYGITDANIASGVITLGSNTITPVTSVNGHTGSSVDVTAADLGLSNAMHFIGVVASNSTNTPSDGSNSVPTITGLSSYTPAAGDVVIDKDNLREYVWSNGAWILLGFTTSSIYNSDSIDASSSDEPTWISNIQQVTDGKISVQRQTIGTLGIGHGGTGKSEWTQWGIVYASATNTLAQVTAGASTNINQPLISGGLAAPEWYAGLTLIGNGTQESPYDATFSNTVTITGATTLSSTLSVTESSTLTGKVGIGASPDNNYQLYVNGASLLNGNTTVNGNLIPGANNTKTLGSTSARWSKLYIGSADNHGDAYTPIYWDDGAPTAVTPVQYCEFTINNGKTGVRLIHNAFTENSYVLQIVVTSGESNLNSAIEWESSSEGYIDLTCSATSGDVQGYILVSRGGALSQVASEDLPLAEET